MQFTKYLTDILNKSWVVRLKTGKLLVSDTRESNEHNNRQNRSLHGDG